MQMIIDFCLYDNRDEAFISNQFLLDDFLTYFHNLLSSIPNIYQLIAITNNDRLLLNLDSIGLNVQFLIKTKTPHSYKTRILSLLEAHLPDASTSGQLFIISPFKGVITLNRINTMLNNATINTTESYSSMVLLNSNQNPIRFNTIPQKNDTGKIATIKPESFLSTLDFISLVKKEYIQPLSNYINSQFTPEFYAIDEALIITQKCLLKDNNVKQLMPVLAPVSEKENIPLLYKLPIFNFSKNSILSF